MSKEGVPATPFKPATTNEEQYVTYGSHDWAAIMKSYCRSGATPPQAIFASAPAPSSHQYSWSGGKHFIGGFATSLPCASSYPHGGIYAHPSMHQGQLSYYGYFGMPNSDIAMSSVPAAPESEGNPLQGYEQSPMRNSNRNIENLGLINRKSIDCEEVRVLENNDLPQSGMLGPSEINEADHNPDELQSVRTSDQVDENGNLAVQSTSTLLGSLPEKPVVTSTYNFNITTDSRSESSVVAKSVKSHFSAAGQASCDGVVSQDEHELRRMKRKQSNRESARRSRLRRQKECEKLSTKVEEQQAGTADIKKIISRIKDEINELITENKDIVGDISKYLGEDNFDMRDEVTTLVEADHTNRSAVIELRKLLTTNKWLEGFFGEFNLSSTERNEAMCDTNGKGHSSEDGTIGSDTS